MIRRSPPVFLSMLLLGALPAASGARGQEPPPAASQDAASRDATDQGAASQDAADQPAQAAAAESPAAESPAAESPAAKGVDGRKDGRIAITRSDGSTGLTTPPDPKQIRKLVGYIRAGMNRADNADRQRQTTRRVNSNRRATKARK
jgi:hypothetical protein